MDASGLDFRRRANDILRETEDAIRTLLIEATHAGDYEALRELSRVASHVHWLIEEDAAEPAELGSLRTDGKLKAVRREKETRESVEPNTASNLTDAPTEEEPRESAGQYPRFIRDNENLVRVVFSTETDEESETAVSFSMLEGIVDMLEITGHHGEALDALRVAERLDRDCDAGVSREEVEAGLDWLLREGIARRDDTNHHTLNDPSGGFGAMKDAWEALFVRP